MGGSTLKDEDKFDEIHCDGGGEMGLPSMRLFADIDIKPPKAIRMLENWYKTIVRSTEHFRLHWRETLPTGCISEQRRHRLATLSGQLHGG